ncbi:MAG: gamma-glutamyltransferase [bacterium]|nr:gamma-glutamyltransferase [bacterium]
MILTFFIALPNCHRQLELEADLQNDAGSQTGETIDYRSISTAQLRPPKIGGSPERYWSRGKQYMIASDAPEASRAGVAMYAAGGNAVDAAVAVSFAISVVRPQSTGLGGGGFMLVHLAKARQTIAYDFRERAPAAATRDMYLDQQGKVIKGASLNGARAVGVPGMIAGLVEVHRRHGSLPLAQVIAPALSLARDGFPVYQDLHDKIARVSSSDTMGPAMRAVFTPGDRLPAVGEILIQKDLAKTLSAIAAGGAAPIHSRGGAIAKDLDAYMRTEGGAIRLQDLADYRVRATAPLWGQYRDHKIAIMPPPSSGVFILEMLGMLQTKDLRALYERYGDHPYGRPAQYEHFLAEVFRRGYADRAKLGGDPAFFPVPTELLTSREYTLERAADIALDEASESKGLSYPDTVGAVSPGAQRRPARAESRETTHFSILDSRGDAVSSTQSVNVIFGARVMLPGWGIVLNDTMDDFSAAPDTPNAYGLVGGEANAIAPGKTPLSSMSPTIVFARPGERIWNGRKASVVAPDELRPRLVLGSPGGSRIITAILHTIVNDIDFGLHPYASVARGRIHHQYLPDKLFFADSPAGLGRMNELEALGHTVADSRWQAKVFAVRADAAGFVGVSDPRGDGRPLGDQDQHPDADPE